MTDVIVIDKDVVVEVKQPTVPAAAQPPKIGLVEINQLVQRGSVWSTGHAAPTMSGGQAGDMYLDVDTGDIYRWDGAAWVFQGTFAPATLTPAEILAALITVDGDGSNLDADLLDGQHGAFYATQSDMDAVHTKDVDQDAAISANVISISFNAAAISDLQTDKADKDSPTLTGDPKAPTPPVGDNDTSIATTAFVTGAVSTSTTAAAILTKLLTVDGAGSNLDADLLDGQHGAYYLDLSHSTNVLPPARFSDASHGPRAGGNLHALATPTVAGFMQDAPADSFVYGRKNGAWSTVIGGATTDDAPPAGPLQDGQLWWKSSTGVLYLWYADANSSQWVQVSASPQVVDNNYARKTAETRNRVVNGAMQISQENGTTSLTITNTYPVDQWTVVFTTTGAVSFQQVLSTSPKGSPNRLRLTVTTADASLAAGEFVQILQRIEGAKVADFRYGSADAQQAVLRFGFKGPAGTYSIALRNNAQDRVYLATFTVTAGQANTDTEQTVVIPGDITGTWLVGNNVGITLAICLAAGTTFQGAAGWQAGNLMGVAGMSNGLATVSNVFELFDVGFYLDADQTGLPSPWQLPDDTDELARCQRYWQKSFTRFSGNVTSASSYTASGALYVPPRTGPSLSAVNNQAVGFPATPGTLGSSDAHTWEVRVANATAPAGFASSITVNARM
jgi:hypothetical protein